MINMFVSPLGPTDWAELEAMKQGNIFIERPFISPTDWAELEAMKLSENGAINNRLWSYGLSRIRGDETYIQDIVPEIPWSYGLSRIRGDETLFFKFCQHSSKVLRIEPN